MTQTVQRSSQQFRTVAAWVVPSLQLWLSPVTWKKNPNTLELNYKGFQEQGVNLNHTSDFVLFSTSFSTSGVWGTGMWTFHADRSSLGCVSESYLWMLWLGVYQWQLSHDVAAGKGRSCHQDGAAECLLFLFPEGGNVEGVCMCVCEGFMVAAGIWKWNKATSLTRKRHFT